MDLHDTFLEIAGITPIDSKSLIPVIKGEKGKDSTFVFQGWAKDNYHATYIEGSRKWIVTNRPDGRRLYEMYDVVRDPYEMNDLWPVDNQGTEWRNGLDVLDAWTREQEALL
jgi:hypothetical protein